jgi:hypothetical protein
MNQNWSLIADARLKILRWWNLPAALILLLVILQSALGKYQGPDLFIAWLWLFIQLFPASFLCYASTWLNKYSQKLIPPASIVLLRNIALLHLLLVLGTLLLMPFVPYNLQPGQYLLRSLLWTTLSNFLLIVGLLALFYRKETRLKPNAAIILNVAKQESIKALKKGALQRQQCLNLIADNQLAEAFELMRRFLENHANSENDVNALVLLESRFVNVQQQTQMGLVDRENAQLEINRITEALLNLSLLVQA